MNDPQMLDYYSRRAAEYERIYHKPERQGDLVRLRDHVRGALAGRKVLEVACGTGYWTAVIADAADSVLATDASNEVLEVARSKNVDSNRVTLARADAWNLGELKGDFDAGVAMFWWSHIPKQKLSLFLKSFHSALRPGSRVLFADNRFVAGSSTAISRRDDAGNTYQLRPLDDGSTHEVLKNFPTRSELIALVGTYANTVDVVEYDYFWCLSYELKPSILLEPALSA